ncbi:Hypothetical predicted protein, partial [Pelobates cultripes]
MAAPRKPPIQPAGGPRRTTSPDELLHRELTTGHIPPLDMGGPQVCDKCGILISHSSALKKARDHTIRELTAKIGTLTQAHKQTLDNTLLGELTAAREELARTLRQSYTRALQRTKSFFYTEGDKCGRLLARMINKKRSMTYIA